MALRAPRWFQFGQPSSSVAGLAAGGGAAHAPGRALVLQVLRATPRPELRVLPCSEGKSCSSTSQQGAAGCTRGERQAGGQIGPHPAVPLSRCPAVLLSCCPAVLLSHRPAASSPTPPQAVRAGHDGNVHPLLRLSSQVPLWSLALTPYNICFLLSLPEPEQELRQKGPRLEMGTGERGWFCSSQAAGGHVGACFQWVLFKSTRGAVDFEGPGAIPVL